MYGGFVKYSSFRAPTEEQLRDALIDSLQNDSNTRRVTALRDAVRKLYSSESNVSSMELKLHDFSLPMISAGITSLGIDECCLLMIQQTSQPQDKPRPPNWQAGLAKASLALRLLRGCAQLLGLFLPRYLLNRACVFSACRTVV